MIIPGRSWKEWYNENKEKRNEYNKEYRNENKEILLEKEKTYRIINAKRITENYKINKEKNKDKKNETEEKYRNANKELISAKQKEKIECQCGCFINRSCLGRHQKTKKHLDLMLNKIV